NGQTLTQAGTYTATITTSTCDSTATLTLVVNPIPAVTAEEKEVCEGGSVQLTASPAGGVWSGTGVTNGVFNAAGLAPGTYTVIYNYSQGCTASDTATITVNAKSTSITTVTVCPNQLPYVWNGTSYTQPGTYYFVTTNAVGCDSTASLVLVVTQVITGPTENVTVCANTLPYTWNGMNITQAGTYTAILQNQAGCDSTATLNLSTQPLATATITGGNPICPGASTTISISLTGTAPWTIVYTDGSNTNTINNIQSTPYVLTVSPTTTTTYTVLSVADAKCSNGSVNSSVTVDVITAQTGIRYPTVTVFPDVPRRLQAREFGSNTTYLWTPPTGLNTNTVSNPVFKYDQSVEYTITIGTDNGCKIVDTLLVLVPTASPDLKSDIWVPKAWSPNKDGHNDKLRPLTLNIREIYYFRIFDRWGQLMFETNEIGKGWDGIFNGKEQVQDVYTWTLEAMGEDGKHYKRSGNSILLR
ncbi:MAG TPA: T9SS type B sorting domain-containing protein, partial [Chitinophagaceae bacterium]|nr:T9SS type B sorting domain-containing protein [Chitinophagaceae bacterium]